MDEMEETVTLNTILTTSLPQDVQSATWLTTSWVVNELSRKPLNRPIVKCDQLTLRLADRIPFVLLE